MSVVCSRCERRYGYGRVEEYQDGCDACDPQENFEIDPFKLAELGVDPLDPDSWDLDLVASRIDTDEPETDARVLQQLVFEARRQNGVPTVSRQQRRQLERIRQKNAK